MNIYGKKIVLRALEFEDGTFLRNMLNNPEMEEKVVGWAFPVSKYAQDQWYKDNYADNKNQRFIVETLEGEAIGLASLTDIDWKNRVALFGFKLEKPENRNKGVGKDILMATLRYAFDELQLNRIEYMVLENNMPSRVCAQKCGFVEEGKKRSAIYKNGKYNNIIILSILVGEYRSLVNKDVHSKES